MSTKKNLLLLFDRPQELSFMLKGDNDSVFDVPEEYLPDEKYKPIVNFFLEQAKEKIPVKVITVPDLGEILKLDRNENFSVFIEKHRKIAARLIDIFLGVTNVDDLLSVAVYARDRVNPYLFNYAFSVALLHRPDTQDLDIPSFIRLFPDKFVDAKVFDQAREAAEEAKGSKMPIDISKDYTASDLEIEHRVAYFREDLGVNLHYWHWHLVYPFEATREIVTKNRRGELFYYMHQQIIARYNFERLSNRLKPVESLIDWRSEIKEAYFPKLDSLVAGRSWPFRMDKQKLNNLRRDVDQINIDVDELERWRDRILEAINSKTVRTDQGQTVELTDVEGIDVLGNMIESSILSPDRAFYGDLHNMGHVFISYIHDPDHRHLESFGVMGDPATAMRDPVFYRWHAYIDDMFQNFKSSLSGYPVDQLNYSGITVEDVTVETGGQKNSFQTHWRQSAGLDLSRGMDFLPRGPIFVRFTHLEHQPFSYKITVNNETDESKEGTCRIFLSPKHDQKGHPLDFAEQRRMFIELDKFKVNLKQGQNTITRSSTQSSVSIPFERTFQDLDTSKPQGEDELAKSNTCGCGWPQHMLIPKGSPAGMKCQLFVMISNYDDDKVEQNLEGICLDADSYCGIKDKLYPDRRSMGYPFDRKPRDGVKTLQEFLTSNMKVQDVTIKFSDVTFKAEQRN